MKPAVAAQRDQTGTSPRACFRAQVRLLTPQRAYPGGPTYERASPRAHRLVLARIADMGEPSLNTYAVCLASLAMAFNNRGSTPILWRSLPRRAP